MVQKSRGVLPQVKGNNCHRKSSNLAKDKPQAASLDATVREINARQLEWLKRDTPQVGSPEHLRSILTRPDLPDVIEAAFNRTQNTAAETKGIISDADAVKVFTDRIRDAKSDLLKELRGWFIDEDFRIIISRHNRRVILTSGKNIEVEPILKKLAGIITKWLLLENKFPGCDGFTVLNRIKTRPPLEATRKTNADYGADSAYRNFSAKLAYGFTLVSDS